MCSRKQQIILLLAIFLIFAPSTVAAQDAAKKDGDAAKTDAKADDKKEAADKKDDKEDDDKEDDDEDDDKEDDEDKESADGSYEWKFSYGGGLEAGLFFTGLNRWDTKFLEPSSAPVFDSDLVYNLDLAFEISPIEAWRFTLFGGFQTPLTSNPGLSSAYFGIEPAAAFRRDMWEMALALGLGFGRTELNLDNGNSATAGLIVMRPALELRRYMNDFFALYGRVGFNYWISHSIESQGLTVDNNAAMGSTNLNEGGLYLALGIRFGSYPEHIKRVSDTDGDGFKDDVDECPQEPEDTDGFEDKDGCPELDNDKDGIPDDKDQCRDVPEDKDGWKDDDGCPEDDDDQDGDGILNKDDKCVDKAEDKDGFEDADGCPDLDNDKDGIPDDKDKCRDKPGVPEKAGCPFQRVEVTLKKIVIREKIFFELNKADIQPKSFGLLDEIAKVFNATPRIKKVEIQGHTDSAGKAKNNLKLSTNRAKAVYDYLVSKGVNKDRLIFKGYGFTKPLIPVKKGEKELPETAEKNRRVEFLIVDQDTVKKTVREDKVGTVKGADKTSVKPK